MLPLLQSVEAMSGCRDRGRLPDVLLRAVGGMLGARADVGLFLREPSLGRAALRRFEALTTHPVWGLPILENGATCS